MSWRSQQPAKPAAPKPKFDSNDDDWETDPTYENKSTEKSQRYGSASVPGSGRVDHVDFQSIQDKAKTVDQNVKDAFKEKNPTRGYGGRYGTEQVMDKAAQDFSYKAEITKHSSQTDGKKGFGGEHGVDERAKDQSAVGYDYKSTTEKHSSQKDYTTGFSSKQDVEKKESNVSSTHTPPSPSPKPPATAAKPPITPPVKLPATPPVKTPATPPVKPPVSPPVKPSATPPVTPSAKPPATPPPPKPSAESNVTEKPAESTTGNKSGVGGIRARFENLNKEKEAEAAKRVAEERKKRTATDQKLQEQQQQQQQQQQTSNSAQEKVKQQEPAPVKEEPTREPSPERSKTPPALGVVDDNPSENTDSTNTETETATTNLNETNDNDNTTTKTSDEPIYENVKSTESTKKEENKQEADRYVGAVNVTAILNPRKISSASSNNGDDNDDWS